MPHVGGINQPSVRTMKLSYIFALSVSSALLVGTGCAASEETEESTNEEVATDDSDLRSAASCTKDAQCTESQVCYKKTSSSKGVCFAKSNVAAEGERCGGTVHCDTNMWCFAKRGLPANQGVCGYWGIPNFTPPSF